MVIGTEHFDRGHPAVLQGIVHLLGAGASTAHDDSEGEPQDEPQRPAPETAEGVRALLQPHIDDLCAKNRALTHELRSFQFAAQALANARVKLQQVRWFTFEDGRLLEATVLAYRAVHLQPVVQLWSDAETGTPLGLAVAVPASALEGAR